MRANKFANKSVRVTFSDRVMMFGNSYKPWDMQYDEYVWMCKQNGTELHLESVETSHSKWVWGGLKWCPEERIQELLNREGCQDGEPDNPKPRQYSKMNFKKDEKAFNKAKKLLDRAG